MQRKYLDAKGYGLFFSYITFNIKLSSLRSQVTGGKFIIFPIVVAWK